MATVKDLAAYVCDKLAGKVLIHRYDAYSTNSVYLKFDYGLGNSLRLSDHTGKAGLNYIKEAFTKFVAILNTPADTVPAKEEKEHEQQPVSDVFQDQPEQDQPQES